MEEGALCLAVPTLLGGSHRTMEVGIRGDIATQCFQNERDLVCIYGFWLGFGAFGNGLGYCGDGVGVCGNGLNIYCDGLGACGEDWRFCSDGSSFCGAGC
jgi:hypothetical protein